MVYRELTACIYFGDATVATAIVVTLAYRLMFRVRHTRYPPMPKSWRVRSLKEASSTAIFAANSA